jgi:hypothetical protein
MLKRLKLLVFSFTLPAAYASIIQSTSTLPPTTGGYAVAGPICFPAACFDNILIGNFQLQTSLISSGNQLTSSTVNLNADGFANTGGVPGTPMGSVLLTGQIDITYFGRSSPTALGTFNAQITLLSLTGMFSGHTIAAMLNPANTSVGVTSINETQGGFVIDSFFDVFAQLSIDGGPFVPGPVRHADLVPEPGTLAPALIAIAGIAAFARRRRRSS